MTLSRGVTRSAAASLQQVRHSSVRRCRPQTRWSPLSSLRSKPTAVCSSRSSWIAWMLPRPCALWGASTLVRTTALTTTESERRKESMAYTSINPANGKLIQSFQEHDDSQVEVALASAETAFLSWRRESFASRAAVGSKTGPLITARVEELSPSITPEMRKHNY